MSKELISELEYLKELEKIDKDIHNSMDKDISFLLLEKHKDFIYNELGIRASSLMIYDSLNDDYVSYQNDTLDSMGHFFPQIPFILNNEDYKEIIDMSFIAKRREKTPEFHKFFQKKAKIEPLDRNYMHEFWDNEGFPKLSFSQFKYFYRPAKETIFFLYAWRYFVRLMSRVELGTVFSNFEEFYFPSFKTPTLAPEKWFKITTGFDFSNSYEEFVKTVKQKQNNSKEESERIKLESIIQKIASSFFQYQSFEYNVKSDSNFINLEWDILGININSLKGRLSFKSLISYAHSMSNYSGDSSRKFDRQEIRSVFKNCFDLINEDKWHEIDKEKVHKTLVKLFYFLFQVETNSKTKKPFDKLLKQLIESVKFPIFPYFLELFFDKASDNQFHWHSPKEHLVFPIWYSKDSTIKEENESTSKYVAYVLVSMEPVWSFKNHAYHNDQNSNSKISKIQELNILRIKNFFQVINKRLIEKGYFENVVKKQLLKPAITAAISQVMVRNLSHNIGSHVMNKLINGKNIKDLKLSNSKNCNYKSIIEIESLGDDGEPNNQLAIFNNYVKCRMDYLSDITFGTPLMQTSKKVYPELFKELDKVRLLLENISGLSAFPFKIIFKENLGTVEINLEETSSLTLAMPNDILGCQAFFNIIENIIRNTAKHSKGKEKVEYDQQGNKTILFTIQFKDISLEKNIPKEVSKDSLDYYIVEISDNIPVEGFVNFESEEEIIELKTYLEDYNKVNNIQISEKEEIKNINYLVYSQNRKLNDSILQHHNSLRASGLGLIEMEASASYLRKLDISNIESDSFNINYNDELYNKDGNLNIIKAFKTKNNNLGYRFFMLRPAEVLIITEKKFENEICNHWLKLGVKIVNLSQIKEELALKKSVFNHKFLIYDNDDVISFLETKSESNSPIYKTSLPLRFFKMDDINQLFISHDFENLETIVWREWEKKLKKIFNYSDLVITNSYLHEYDFSNNKYLIAIYDHLSEDLNNKGNNEEAKKDINEIDNVFFYADALSSKAQEKLPNFEKLKSGVRDRPLKNYVPKFSPISKEDNFGTFVKLAESYLYKVLVIDERIQEVLKDKYLEIENRRLFLKSGILVPEKLEINLSGQNIVKEDLENCILNYSLKLCKNNDFILIHYSILERAFGNIRYKINNYLKELSKNYNIVVTSGRGTPEGLPIDVRFINLSSVIDSFVALRSKYLINYILHSSRKSNRL